MLSEYLPVVVAGAAVLQGALLVYPLLRLCRRIGLPGAVALLGMIPLLGYALALGALALAPRRKPTDE